MHRFVPVCLALLALGLAALAPEARASDKAQDRRPGPDVTRPKPADDEADRTRSLYADLEAAYEKDLADHRRAIQDRMEKAIAEGGPVPAMPMGVPYEVVKPHLYAFSDAASQLRGDQSIPFHVWILRHGHDKKARSFVDRAMSELVKRHVASPGMVEVPDAVLALEPVLGRRRIDSVLKRIEEGNRDVDVLAASKLARLTHVIQRAPMRAPQYAEAKEELLRAKSKAKDPVLQARIQAVIDGREGLADGDLAPDIAGVDMDGVEFKLSDYKGKIILLDFWGDW